MTPFLYSGIDDTHTGKAEQEAVQSDQSGYH